MNQGEQINAFHAEIGAVIHRFRREFDLPYSAVIGSLQIHAHDITAECLENSRKDDDDDTSGEGADA